MTSSKRPFGIEGFGDDPTPRRLGRVGVREKCAATAFSGESRVEGVAPAARDGPSDRGPGNPPIEPRHPDNWLRWAQRAVLAIPVVGLAWAGWANAQIVDDGFIYLRVVHQ